MGYNPAGNLTTSPSIGHLATVWYNRTALDQLKQMNRFYNLCEPDMLPKRNGPTVQWYRYSLFGENTTPHAEGTVGTALTLGSSTVSATIKEYADFTSVSSFLEDTAIDPIVDNAAENLAYRASISVDKITRNEFDANSSPAEATIGTTFTASDVRAAVAKLKAINVRPKTNDTFVGVIHPYITFDLQSDNTAGGFIDQLKYAEPGGFMSGEIGKVGGVRLMESTNVNTSGTAPNVLYYSYIVGKGAVGAVDLQGSGPSKVTDPSAQSFKVNVIKGGPSQADPEGMIGSYVSYLYRYVVKTLDSTNYRYRMPYANASLV